MTENEHPERREEDRSHFWRAAHEIYDGWQEHVSTLAKTVTVVGFMVTVFAGIATGLVTVGVLKADYQGIPERVERHDRRLDSLRQARVSDAIMIEDNLERLDSLGRALGDTREGMREIRGQLQQLEAGQSANRCWIMVAAGQRSRFDCSP